MPPPRIHYIFIEGNIGVGKSTFLQAIVPVFQTLGLHVVAVPEPLQAWQDIQGYNLLESFYSDPTRWACTFQSHAMATRVQAINTALQSVPPTVQDVYVLCERSIYADKHIFVKSLYTQGKLTPMEYATYDVWWNFLRPLVYPGIHAGVVYLRASPQTCYERTKARHREEEARVPLEYFQELDTLHERAIHTPITWNSAPRLVIDENENILDDAECAHDCVQRIVEAFVTKV